MFEGVAPPSSATAAAADQFHKFSSTANQSSSSSPHLPLHLSFTSSSSTTTTPPIFPITFDPYHHHHHQVLQPASAPSILLQPNFFHPLNYNPHTPANARSIIKNIHHHQDKQLVEQAAPTIQQDSPWSNEEVLSLLRIRSSMELNWFPSPEFTWEHVSRKLSEVGFKRSAEKCRDKFEEESRYINTINSNNNNNSNHNYQRGFSNHHDDELVNHLHNHADVSHPQLYHSNDDNANNKTNHEDDGDGSEHLAKQAQERKDKIDDVDDVDDDDDPDHTADTGDENDHDHDDDYGHKQDPMNQLQNPSSSSIGNTTTSKSISNNGDKKRKRKRSEEDKFEMFKGFCQDIVDKMMAQQEEMQNKLIEDMIKRDQEKLAREDAWKKQELDRINHDLQLRSDQQSLAGDRQSSILKFLQNFPTANPRQLLDDYHQKVPIMISSNNNGIRYPVPTSSSSSSAASQPNPKNTESESKEAGLRAEIRNETRPIQSEFKSVQKDGNRNSDSNPPHKSCGGGELENSQREEVGKRWPRDEVLALINLRCGIYNNNNGGSGGGRNDVATEKEGGSSSATTNKAPLWERISRGMMELGYKRSAKRCKEKWENINKYFRKTKDLNKKRSLDSRTCPYFHQLSSLYGGNGAAAAAEDAGTMPEILP
ncbi:Trihelix transcription factor GTL2 [Linum perenne]